MFRAHFFRPVKRSNLSSNTIMAYCEALLVIAKSCSLLPHYRPISISTLQSQNDYKYNQTYTNCRVQFCASVNHQIASIGEAYKKLAVVDEKVARYCHTICTPVYLQIFITLRILAAGCFQLDAGDLFGLSKPTVCRIFHRVVLALSRQLQMSARFVQYCSTLSLTIVLRLDCL